MNRRTAFLFSAAFAISVLFGHPAMAQSASSDEADAIAPIPGDYNSSGLVEQADLDLVLGNWGNSFDPVTMPTWTNDPAIGVIDQGELDKVLGNWGKSSSSIVPEPATLSLLGLCAAAGFAVWQRQRSRYCA